jgi:hypothetical protein
MSDVLTPPTSVQAARDELTQVENWLAQVQQQIPAMQQRGAFLHGFIAAALGPEIPIEVAP